MTLLEIATLAAETTQQTDADALAMAKKFAAFKYEKTFREHLWRDSVSVFPFLLDPTGNPTTPTGNSAELTALAVQGRYLMPDSVERVLALRTASLDAVAWSGRSGDNPAARQWAGVDPARLFRLDVDAFAEEGEPVGFCAEGAVAALFSGNGRVSARAASASDTGVTVRLTAVNALTNQRSTATLALTTTAQTFGPTWCREVLSFSKPATAGAVYLGDESGAAMLTLEAAATGAPLCVPVRIFPLPYTDRVTAFRALVKRRPLTLTDNDTPDLRGIEDVCLEYATGKLRELAGQVQTAQANYARSDAALGAMMATELLQTAENPRMMPEDGYGQ